MPACFAQWPGEGRFSLELVPGLPPPTCPGEAGLASALLRACGRVVKFPAAPLPSGVTQTPSTCRKEGEWGWHLQACLLTLRTRS